MVFSLDDTKEQIVKNLNNAHDVPQTIQIGVAFLNYKIQEELLEKQNEHNRKMLTLSGFLAAGTWALVFVTLLLVNWDNLSAYFTE